MQVLRLFINKYSIFPSYMEMLEVVGRSYQETPFRTLYPFFLLFLCFNLELKKEKPP